MKKVKHGGVFTAIFSIISIGYIFPIMLVFINLSLIHISEPTRH